MCVCVCVRVCVCVWREGGIEGGRRMTKREKGERERERGGGGGGGGERERENVDVSLLQRGRSLVSSLKSLTYLCLRPGNSC